ncbi:MAG TPA: peptide chain release factor N(5)-glutamine methyltransferase [Ramlibacter sp.]|nr:peptide chain release factor N(5)-glutamine methyltransferase [Ramlibacter sp.]
MAADLGLERVDAQLLLLQALGRPASDRAWLLAHDTDALDANQQQQFTRLCGRRAAGEPLAYIAGHREFYGLELAVDSRVLVPRPETETLVDWALEVLAGTSAPHVIDLGTGSGAIALAIKARRPDAQVVATDHSPRALEVAAGNAHALGVDIELRRASWLAGICERFDLVVSNPPYVAAADPHLAALGHEPLNALVAGPDGLDDLRTIVAQAPACLRDCGWLLVEHGYDQAAAVRALLAHARFRQVASRADLAGIERCSGGQWLELG